MNLQLLKAGTADALTLNGISKRAFDSDVLVGADTAGGPPGYMSVPFHTKMARQGHLCKLTDEGLIVGGAILFLKDDVLNVARIFVAPEHYRKGYGIFMMQEIEKQFPEVKEYTLDTPVWNTRTNAFYSKLGYTEIKRDGEFVYYSKKTERKKTMEYWDLYDSERQPLNRVHARGEAFAEGEYYVCAEVWVKNSKGQFLIIKRHPDKKAGNLWEFSGGGTLAGESTIQSAVRELREETGIDASEEELRLFATYQRKNYFQDLFLLCRDVELSDIVLQPDEAIDVKWAADAEIQDMIVAGEFVHSVGVRFQMYKDSVL